MPIALSRPQAAAPATGTTSAPVPEARARALTAGSPVAQALYEVWRGRPVTVVRSPPGAGKSTLIAELCALLTERTDLEVCVAAFTRDAAGGVAGRIAALMPPRSTVLAVKGWPEDALPAGVLSPSSTSSRRKIVVSTLASLARMKRSGDVLIIDEAYQVTFDLASAASDGFTQVVLVGDPGQIGPVVTANTSAWDHMTRAPHFPAPRVFAARKDAVTLQLPCTYRLGQRTVDVIAPLYDFEFTSARPDRFIEGRAEIEAMRVPISDDPYSVKTATFVAEQAVSFIGAELVDAHGSRRALDACDVAVVVSHNAQQSAIEAILTARGVNGVTVGTADRLQGGQWHAVVALDPLVGKDAASTHSLSSGRLCVMASRHLTALCWVYDERWSSVLGSAEGLSPDEITKGDLVRRRILRAAAAR